MPFSLLTALKASFEQVKHILEVLWYCLNIVIGGNRWLQFEANRVHGFANPRRRNRPFLRRLFIIVSHFPRVVYYRFLLLCRYAYVLYRTPQCKRADQEYLRFCDKVAHEHGREPDITLTTDQDYQLSVELAKIILSAVFDAHTISIISKHARRMALIELSPDNKSCNQLQPLQGTEVVTLMEDGVPAVCISYKHMRRSRDGLPVDCERIEKVLISFMNQLSIRRLLYWCDTIGNVPRGVAWAEQGVDPYLCMPTLRVESEQLREQIEDSFWMTVELAAALLAGGVVTFDEDIGKLAPLSQAKFWPASYFNLLQLTKLYFCHFITNPVFYYRRARCENDKLEILKYAWRTVRTSRVPCDMALDDSSVGGADTFKSGVLEGFIMSTSHPEAMDLFKNMGFFFSSFSAAGPTREIETSSSQPWLGLENFIPALRILDEDKKATLKGDYGLRVVYLNQEDETDELLCGPGWGNFSTLRLRVRGFCDDSNRVSGHVVSFRVASNEEEKHFVENAVAREVCFD